MNYLISHIIIFDFVNEHFDKDFHEFNYKKYDNYEDFIKL